MKTFSTMKIGYTAGIYGCSGEYFQTIVTTEKGLEGFIHYGMYGSEDRVNNALKEKGYTETWIPSIYGKLTRKDVPSKLVKAEHEAIEYVNATF